MKSTFQSTIMQITAEKLVPDHDAVRPSQLQSVALFSWFNNLDNFDISSYFNTSFYLLNQSLPS